MKKSTIEKIEKEINEKTKLSKEIKDKIKKEVLINIVLGAVIITYLAFMILGSSGSVKNVRTIDINIFSTLFLGVAIFSFEFAYRKDNGKFAMYGIEFLVVSIFTLFLPYIIFELEGTNKKYYLMSGICIAVYYILKSIYISIKTKSKYMNEISDVKEIVKKEKTKRRIKEDIEEIKIIDKNKKSDVGVDAHSDPQRKQSKKTISAKEETKPKKRGRPKKSDTTNNKNKPKEQSAPKKRGRPRKVVSP